MNKERELFLQEKSELRASTIELSTLNQKLVEVRTLLENNLWERENKLSLQKSVVDQKKRQLEEARDMITSNTELVFNMEQDKQDGLSSYRSSKLSIATSFSEAHQSDIFLRDDEKLDSPISMLRDNPVFSDQYPEILSPSFSSKAIQSDSERMDDRKDDQFFQDSVVEKLDINILDQELTELEQQLEKMSYCIDEVRNEIGLLPATPETFNEILNMIEHEITGRVKQQFNEIHELAQKRNLLAEGNEVLIREHFQDRLWNLVAREKDCKRSLKKIQKSASDKIRNAAVSFKKNIGSLMRDYWREAKSTRNLMGTLSRKCEQEVPLRFDTVEKAQVAVKNSNRDEERLFSLMEDVARLKKMGQIFGKLEKQESLDCLYDSIELEFLQNTVCTKLGKRTKLLKFRCQQRENEEQLKSRKIYTV